MRRDNQTANPTDPDTLRVSDRKQNVGLGWMQNVKLPRILRRRWPQNTEWGPNYPSTIIKVMRVRVEFITASLLLAKVAIRGIVHWACIRKYERGEENNHRRIWRRTSSRLSLINMIRPILPLLFVSSQPFPIFALPQAPWQHFNLLTFCFYSGNIIVTTKHNQTSLFIPYSCLCRSLSPSLSLLWCVRK